MPTEDAPTGVAYLKTFQALFQIVEMLVLLVVWSLIASQGFFHHLALSFALGVYVFVWILTVFFFVMYITGFHYRLNECCGKLRRKTPSAPPPSEHPTPFDEEEGASSNQMSSGAVWYVSEYIIYLGENIFLFVSAIIVSAFAFNSQFIAASAFGWFIFIFFTLHFCLLVKNTEGEWPHRVAAAMYETAKNRSTNEQQGLLSSPAATATTSEP